MSRNAPCKRALAMPEVLAGDEARHAACCSRSRRSLRGAEDEQRQQHDGDADGAGDDRRDEHGKDELREQGPPPTTIRRRSKRSATAPAGSAEQQHGQVLGEHRQRHEQRVARQRRDEQRPGGQGDPVAEVGDDGRGQQPAEAPAESGRRDGLGDPGGRESHRPEDSNAMVNPVASMRGVRLSAVALHVAVDIPLYYGNACL